MDHAFNKYRGLPKGPAREEMDRLIKGEENGEFHLFFNQQAEAIFEENKLRQSYLKSAIIFLPEYLKRERIDEKSDFEFLIKHVDVTIQKLEKVQNLDEKGSDYLNSVIRLANALKDLLHEGFYQQADLASVQKQLKERLSETNKDLNKGI